MLIQRNWQNEHSREKFTYGNRLLSKKQQHLALHSVSLALPESVSIDQVIKKKDWAVQVYHRCLRRLGFDILHS